MLAAATPAPAYDYLLISLGGCASMTVGLYARRKKWPLENITVSLRHSRIHAKDCEECITKEGMLDRIDVEIELTGPLTAEQHAKLMEQFGFAIDYQDRAGNFRYYEPDFVALISDGTHYIVETKGLEDCKCPQQRSHCAVVVRKHSNAHGQAVGVSKGVANGI